MTKLDYSKDQAVTMANGSGGFGRTLEYRDNGGHDLDLVHVAWAGREGYVTNWVSPAHLAICPPL